MRRDATLLIASLLALVVRPAAQPADRLRAAADALGAGAIKTLRVSAIGASFSVGQSPNPTEPWPRVTVKSYDAAIDYDSASMRVEMVRTQGVVAPRGGGQPFTGDQRQIHVVSGRDAWNVLPPPPGGRRGGEPVAAPAAAPQAGAPAPAPAAPPTAEPQPQPGSAVERMQQIWLTPHGFLKGAMANRADVKSVPNGTEVSFTLGCGAGVQACVPSKFTGHYLTGGSHHSVAIDMGDHIVLVEAPLDEERSLAVIAKIKEAIPNKPIRFVVNTHHHFDHAGGLRTFVDEGATIVTHQMNRRYYEDAWAAPRTLHPDHLARSGRRATFQTFTDKDVLKGANRTIEVHRIANSPHHDGFAMVYLPADKILIEADAYTPAAEAPPAPAAAPAAPAPTATPLPPPPPLSPTTVNLYENIRRLKLDVERIAALHGPRLATLEDLAQAIGRGPQE